MKAARGEAAGGQRWTLEAAGVDEWAHDPYEMDRVLAALRDWLGGTLPYEHGYEPIGPPGDYLERRTFHAPVARGGEASRG